MKKYSAQVGMRAALLLAAVPLLTANAAPPALGHITATTGATSVQRVDGSTQAGSETSVYQGDKLISGNGGWLRLEMQGGATVIVRPHSSVMIAGADKTGVAYKVHAGGVNVMTKSPLQVISPGGTVKTAKADFDTMQCSGNCFHISGKPYPNGLYVWVKSGSAKINTSNTHTAGLASGKRVRVAYDTVGDRAFGTTISDVGSLRLTAATGSAGASYSAGAVVYLAAGAGPVTLSVVPDFFLSATFPYKIKIPQFPRIETGLGVKGGVGVSPN